MGNVPECECVRACVRVCVCVNAALPPPLQWTEEFHICSFWPHSTLEVTFRVCTASADS